MNFKFFLILLLISTIGSAQTIASPNGKVKVAVKLSAAIHNDLFI